ncbi:hypothetical protein BCV71DRAFT_257255 [Rhizopus microsporus]|uniref:F-box domain-containing protein n=1 Tax=Rhizopus microsporus TaxID=58291 RepID=A0A1X0RUK6_RHIZD|nr:hypothetical protein BCV71DRAFT_257255 [Rhizopus microsporus]
MSTIQHLPMAVLELIFKEIKVPEDIKNCKSVCINWMLFEKITLYSHHDLQQYLQLITQHQPDNSRLAQVGEYATQLSLQFICGNSCISRKDFEKLVVYCPNIGAIYLDPHLFDGCISAYLLDIDDSVKWRLRVISSCDFNHVNMTVDHFYKYKDSITQLYAPPVFKDVSFLTSFPSLQRLWMSQHFSINTMQDFIFIFDACPKLIELEVNIATETCSKVVPIVHTTYPYLKTLIIKNYARSTSRAFIDYITQRFVNLSNLCLWITHLPTQIVHDKAFDQLLNFFFKQAKQSFSIRLFIINHSGTDADTTLGTIVCSYLNTVFRSTPNVYNDLSIYGARPEHKQTEISFYLEEKANGQLNQMATLYDPRFAQEFGLIPYLESVASRVHRLLVADNYHRQKPIPSDIWSFVERCYRLEKLQLEFYSLTNTQHCINRSIRHVVISKAVVSSTFFKSLAASFPNLRVLHVEYTRAKVETSFPTCLDINLADLNLDVLYINRLCLIGINFDKTDEIVLVETSETSTCLKISYDCDTEDYIVTKVEERDDRDYVMRISCQKIHTLEMFNVRFTLDT